MTLIDARTLPAQTTLETEVCIIGAGAAGIALARELMGQPFRVVLLESGGLRPARGTQSLYRGENTGLPYLPLHVSRFRGFGGTTHRWAGWCRPLDPIDFERREWVPYSGWPFGRSHLESFYHRAHALCELGTYGYEVERWEAAAGPRLPFVDGRLETRIFHFSPPTRFGKVYRGEIARATNVTACLHATVLELETDDAGTEVVRVRARTPGGELVVRSKIVVLAAGGIENARLLLLSRRARPAGLGNDHGLVGRFFMEHPYLLSGTFRPSVPMGLYSFPSVKTASLRGRIVGALVPSAQTLRRERMVNCAVYFRRWPWYKTEPAYASEAVASLFEVRNALRRGELPEATGRHLWKMARGMPRLLQVGARKAAEWRDRQPRYAIRAVAEPVPNPSSRLTLSPERDAFGLPRVRLEWRLGELERRSLDSLHRILREEVDGAHLGQVELSLRDTETGWPPTLSGAGHHMGTTRMNRDPKQGVVDEHGRVHGVANLFVAGSSVFPTAGYANPTLTLLALTLRLADHLKGLLTSRIVVPEPARS